MGSESISTLILFIAAMIVAAGVAGVLVTNVTEISGSIDTYGGEVSDRIDTDVEIISDPGSDAVHDEENATVTLLVKNTGDRTIPAEAGEFDILLDGEYVMRSNLSVTLLEDSSWRTGAVAMVDIDLDEPLETGEHRIVLTTRGDEEVFEFYVP